MGMKDQQRECVNAEKRRQRWISMVMDQVVSDGVACFWQLHTGEREPWFHYRVLTPNE